MVREAKPPVVPPRPEKLRPQPRPRSPAPSPSSPLIPANSPPSIYSQQTSVAVSPNIGALQQDKPTKKRSNDKGLEKEVAVVKEASRPSSGEQAAVKFTSSTAGGSRSPSLGPTLFVIEKGPKEAAVEKQTVKHASTKEPAVRVETPTHATVPTRKPTPSQRSISESKGKQKEKEVHDKSITKEDSTQRAVSISKTKSAASTEIARSTRSHSSKATRSAVSVSDAQSLLRSSHSGSRIQRLQQHQDVYRTHTSSAEARALYAEAKDHYGKAKNHLQEALKLSVDVFRLAPHVLVENVVTKEIRPKNMVTKTAATKTTVAAPTASLVSVNANRGVRYVPEYPGLGIQYRSLFTPLLGNVGSNERDRKQALEKKRADDALVQGGAAVVKYTGSKSSVAGSSRSGRSNTTSRSVPTKASAAAPVPPPASTAATVATRVSGHSNRQRPKRRSAPAAPSRPASVSTRTAARMRDNYELRSRARTKSAASRKLRKRSQEEVDHGIMWFFSY